MPPDRTEGNSKCRSKVPYYEDPVSHWGLFTCCTSLMQVLHLGILLFQSSTQHVYLYPSLGDDDKYIPTLDTTLETTKTSFGSSRFKHFEVSFTTPFLTTSLAANISV